MASINKLSIRGVRSFSPDDAEQVWCMSLFMIKCGSKRWSSLVRSLDSIVLVAVGPRILFSLHDHCRRQRLWKVRFFSTHRWFHGILVYALVGPTGNPTHIDSPSTTAALSATGRQSLRV